MLGYPAERRPGGLNTAAGCLTALLLTRPTGWTNDYWSACWSVVSMMGGVMGPATDVQSACIDSQQLYGSCREMSLHHDPVHLT